MKRSTEMRQWNKDEILPDGNWEFDDEVTACFDDMLSRSIPQYDMMRKIVSEMASNFLRSNTNVIDIGCSKGDVISSLLPYTGNLKNINFIGCDVSKPMLDEATKKFESYSNIDIVSNDLKYQFPNKSANLILSVLTLQFIPIEYRQNILQNIYNSLNESGAFILVEKVLGSSCEIDNVLCDVYYKLKSKNGYNEEQIKRKKMALEGVLVPVTAPMNCDFLKSAGFRKIDCFWRWMNFSGWIAIK